MTTQDPTLNLYNPATLDPAQLLAEFIDRKGLLERILDIIRHNGPGQPQQHVVVIGPRGMGKTTLLCAIMHRVNGDETLKAAWLPLLFQEEQYGIGDLADFWLETIRHFESALGRPALAAEQLLDENPEDMAGQAQERFFQLLAETGQRALLLIDNLNDIFQAIDDGQALHTLRALWMTDPRCMVIGAAPSYFEEITEVDQAFHDFFRTFTLDRLSQDELESFLRGYARMLGDESVIRVIEQAPERVAALRILTGGNPRLVKLGYRVLRDGLDGDLRQDLERLLDEATPFFKHRIDSLKAKEARRVFDAIARRWDPITVDDIRRELRKPSNYVSAQIKRLIDEGFVEETGGDKKKRYQVSERFYNVYYLMRHSREGRRRLRWLVGFMQTFYSRRDFKDWANRLEGELAGPLAEPARAEKLSHLHALSAAAGDDGRGEVFDVIVRDAIARNDRRALDEDIADNNDPVKSHGWRYLLAEIVWLLKPDIRRQLGFRPQGDAWWQRLRRALGEEGLQRARKRLDELGGWRQDTARHAGAAGTMLAWLFQNYVEAEAASRKALELDPQYANAWINLGTALANQNRHAEAEATYRKALELDPDASAWINLGYVLSHQNRHAEAEATYRKALEFDPQHIVAWQNLGILLYIQNRHAEAEAAFRKAIELDPQYATAWSNLGNAMNAQKRLAESEAAYRKALELDQQDAIACYNLGVALNRQNRYAEAEAAYRKALELDPQYGLAHINLGGTYLVGLGRIVEGVGELSLGLALEPDDGYGRWVLLKHWQTVLPAAVTYILAHTATDATLAENLRAALTEVLLEQAADVQQNAVRDALLALDETGQQIFEPLILALQALDDRSLLYRIAREKRELVLDVMKRIGGKTEKG